MDVPSIVFTRLIRPIKTSLGHRVWPLRLKTEFPKFKFINGIGRIILHVLNRKTTDKPHTTQSSSPISTDAMSFPNRRHTKTSISSSSTISTSSSKPPGSNPKILRYQCLSSWSQLTLSHTTPFHHRVHPYRRTLGTRSLSWGPVTDCLPFPGRESYRPFVTLIVSDFWSGKR